eukprot:2887087-Ditylum_brightwellii.AAC.1
MKYDQDGCPKKVKWQFVALRNFNLHDWTNQEVYSPVMSTLEVRFIHHRRPLQSGDIKEAFCQAVHPEDE